MLIVLSPAKSLDFDTAPTTKLSTCAGFLDRSSALIEVLRGYAPDQLAELMSLSDALAHLNVGRYASWSEDHADGRQAIMAFNGDVYAGFDARSLSLTALGWAQDHVRILSGLYGMLRPFDLIHPHRLEMGTRLATCAGKDLYSFWGERITAALNRQAAATGATALVNLASQEYFRSVKPALLEVPVITPVFEEFKGGKYKIISFFAKRARGMMARYAAAKGISDPEKLKRFAEDGYRYDQQASTGRVWVFRRAAAD